VITSFAGRLLSGCSTNSGIPLTPNESSAILKNFETFFDVFLSDFLSALESAAGMPNIPTTSGYFFIIVSLKQGSYEDNELGMQPLGTVEHVLRKLRLVPLFPREYLEGFKSLITRISLVNMYAYMVLPASSFLNHLPNVNFMANGFG